MAQKTPTAKTATAKTIIKPENTLLITIGFILKMKIILYKGNLIKNFLNKNKKIIIENLFLHQKFREFGAGILK
jgi:hypothetical protein